MIFTRSKILISLLIFSLNLNASQRAYIEKTHSYQEGDEFVTEIFFDKPLDFKAVSTEFINQTIQVNIPSGFLKKPYKKSIQNDKVRSLYMYQADKNTLRARIIYKKPIKASDFLGKVSIAYTDRLLRIYVKQGPNKIATRPSPTASPKERTLAQTAKVSPVSKKASQKTQSSLFQELLIATSFFFVLLIVFVMLRNRRKSFIKNPLKNHFTYSIDVIYQHYLGPGKSLTVVKVGEERLLLGVTEKKHFIH